MNTMSHSEDNPSHSILLYPVGTIHNNIKEPFLVAGEGGLTMKGEHRDILDRVQKTKDEVSKIVIRQDLGDLLEGIEEYSHLIILYWAHAVSEKRRSLTKVHPMGRSDLPEVGIFCTCSPARPNPVLMTVVRLHRRQGSVLEVTGLDAIDGSPVIDIKPYVREFYPQEEVHIPAWMQQIQKELGRYHSNE